MPSHVIILTLLLFVMREAVSMNEAFRKAVLSSHNSYRQKAGLLPLVWSIKLANEIKNSKTVKKIRDTLPNRTDSEYLDDFIDAGAIRCPCPSEAFDKI